MPTLLTDDGATLHWHDAGRGRPLVLVHGWSLSSDVFTGMRDALAPAHRVVSLDLRGHGRSSPAPFTLADLGRDLAALLDALDLERAVVAGWSLGAQVVLEALPAMRRRVAALALLSGTPRFTRTEDWPHGLPAQSVAVLGHRVRRDPARALARFFDDLFVPGELAEPDRARLRALRAAIPLPDPAAAEAGLEVLATGDLRPRLVAVDVPVLLAHGEADPICLPGAAREMARAIPGARLALVPGAGHAPFLSRPDAIHELLAGLLAAA